MLDTSSGGSVRGAKGRPASAVGALVPAVMRVRRTGPFAAIMARESRFWWRDGRRRAALVSILVASAVLPVVFSIGAGQGRPDVTGGLSALGFTLRPHDGRHHGRNAAGQPVRLRRQRLRRPPAHSGAGQHRASRPRRRGRARRATRADRGRGGRRDLRRSGRVPAGRPGHPRGELRHRRRGRRRAVRARRRIRWRRPAIRSR